MRNKNLTENYYSYKFYSVVNLNVNICDINEKEFNPTVDRRCVEYF
jgi:hypothetical protein